MSEPNSARKAAEALVGHSRHRQRVNLWLLMGMSWVLIACCSPLVVMWDGKHHTDNYDAALQGILQGPNPDAAIAEMQAIVLRAMAAIRQHEGDSERSGMLARNARNHFLKELAR